MDTQKILDVVLNNVSPICELLMDRDNCNYINKNPEGYKDVTGLCPFRNSGICKFNGAKKGELLHAINSVVTSSSTVNLSNNNMGVVTSGGVGSIPNSVPSNMPNNVPNSVPSSTVDSVPNMGSNVYQEVPIGQFVWVNDDEEVVHISDKLDDTVKSAVVIDEEPINIAETKVVTNKKSAAEKRKEWYKTHVLNKRKRGNK